MFKNILSILFLAAASPFALSLVSAIVKLVADMSQVVPTQRAYDFSFVHDAELQLNKQGWKP
jgi:hypothetical protein